jgi:predicted ATPase
MIKSIHLKGFKSFFDTILPLNNLTVLTGLNSSGKSSVIQALRMLEKSAHNHEDFLLPNHGSLADLKSRFVKDEFSLGIEDEEGCEYTLFLSPDSVAKKADITDFPEIIYISAGRFGPQALVPIYNDLSRRDKIGENGENLFQCIDAIERKGLTLDERLRHEKSEGSTFMFNLRGWLNVISPNVDFDYHLDHKSDTSYSTFDEYRSANVGFGLSYASILICVTHARKLRYR